MPTARFFRVHSFLHSSPHSFIPSFLHSFIPSFLHSFYSSLLFHFRFVHSVFLYTSLYCILTPNIFLTTSHLQRICFNTTTSLISHVTLISLVPEFYQYTPYQYHWHSIFKALPFLSRPLLLAPVSSLHTTLLCRLILNYFTFHPPFPAHTASSIQHPAPNTTKN
ncbi:hypothetical protein BC939DRAFT_270145 [Gamsiella multidivaricata]|uniref:uncharacterized protein n=1 Tax=Gamsiella multidivaricata TaxID=101098 RepID=UPI00221E8A57|nr:uncharacterized protein BC939DRAFT_270145 [Gamsiella multidivaricata]KAI7819155.1 hypothetical protein BC939DRAFT_270145 [Gamsiella multidivaricata]